MRIRELRESHSKTQLDIANYLHIKQNTYSQYENNQRQIPVDMLIALAHYYKVSVDYILELTEIDSPYPKY